MLEPKFTKGEWILNEKSCEVVSENDCSKNGGIDIITRCYCGFNVNTIEEAMANAKLISAAPDMFNALKDLYLDREVWSDLFESQQEFICRVLNKATGSDFFKH